MLIALLQRTPVVGLLSVADKMVTALPIGAILKSAAAAAAWFGAMNSLAGEYDGARATLLAIDDYSLPLKSNLCYYMSAPTVRAEPVLTPSRRNPHATDTIGAYFYGTVLHEGGKFRMWYYGLSREEHPEPKSDLSSGLHEGPVCYAESLDGIRWVKPKLGQVSFNGGDDNNAIALPADRSMGVFVIRDDDDPDPSRRYKMVYENPSRSKGTTVEKAVSPDGIVWKGAGTAASRLEPSSFYKFNGLYTITAHNLAFISEGGHLGGRQGYAWVSPDFDRWLPEAGESFLLAEPANPNDRGYNRPYVQVHVGVGAFSYGNALVGLYCPWHACPKPGDWFGTGTTFGDFGLVVSNDGQHFREVVKGFVYLNRHDSPVSEAAVRPDVRYEEILNQGNGILNVGDETRIYHGRWMNTEKFEDFYSEIALATLPRDRWGALGLFPHASEGAAWTAPMTLCDAGSKVSLNAQGIVGMRVEIADERFRLIPEYSGENAGAAGTADGLDCLVAWPRANLGALGGRRVRLLIHLQRGEYAEPRLFAVYVSSG